MIYLHVPFCRSFCTYCDFYSEIACRERDAQTFEAYTQALCAEASGRRDEIEATRDLDTLYIGGGTPSVLPLSYLERVLDALAAGGSLPQEGISAANSEQLERGQGFLPEGGKATASSRKYSEFTIEVNPEDIVEKGVEYVRGLLALGVNRISMGIQSLDDSILRWMNRRHDAARARQAFAILREAGVENLSVDLIFGLPQLTEATLAQTLDELLRLRPEHISAYQLSVEEGSTLGRMAREGRFTEASQEQCAAQYAQLCRVLGEAGYVHYEISNWALPGREAVHNGAYWTRHPYVGLGPAAHSFDGTTRSWNGQFLAPAASCLRKRPSDPTAALRLRSPLLRCRGWGPRKNMFLRGTPGRHGFRRQWLLREGYEELSPAEEREEQLFLGLRTARGIPEELAGPGAAPLLADGRLTRTPEGRLRIPEAAWFVSDDIISDLI